MSACLDTGKLPEAPRSEAELEELLATPTPALVALMQRRDGDLLILGAGGKMGGSLCTLASRAIALAGAKTRVIAVSRFTDDRVRARLEDAGIETLSHDLLDPEAIRSLPMAPNVIYMVGRKFGTTGEEAQTWASNVIVPTYVAYHYRAARIVAFSTGCVYPLVSAATGGCSETCAPDPVGEYAQSCLGRERVFEYHSRESGTRVCQMRLNYAVDLRYGVLHDIGSRIMAGLPVDLTVSHFNAIWQGDANERALRCLELCSSPPTAINVTGQETVATRDAALALGQLLERDVTFTGDEADGRMYLSDAALSVRHFGAPVVPLATLLQWQASWLKAGLPSLGRPTHFEVSDGRF